MMKLRLWPCKDIDFSWSDVRFALRDCVFTTKSQTTKEGLLDPTHDSLVCMSVRATFDLYLASRGWGLGDECIFVGINVPDMYRIAESRGLSVVGGDLDPITTEVSLSDLREKISRNTRCIVIPHLFGYRYSLSGVIELANRHRIDVVEDCAQAFAGTNWSGSDGATLSLFSFGPMKTASALQGAIAIVRDPILFESMSRRLISYPIQTTWRYFARILRFSAMKIASHRMIYSVLIRTMRFLGVDHEIVIHASTKSATGASFEQRLEMRPCDALIRVIQRQISSSDEGIRRRVAKGERLTNSIGESVCLVLRNQRPNVYWMVPVLVCEQERFKNVLRREGFDVISGRLKAVDRGGAIGATILENALMLPFSPSMSGAELQRLGEFVTDYCDARSQDESITSTDLKG